MCLIATKIRELGAVEGANPLELVSSIGTNKVGMKKVGEPAPETYRWKKFGKTEKSNALLKLPPLYNAPFDRNVAVYFVRSTFFYY